MSSICTPQRFILEVFFAPGSGEVLCTLLGRLRIGEASLQSFMQPSTDRRRMTTANRGFPHAVARDCMILGYTHVVSTATISNSPPQLMHLNITGSRDRYRCLEKWLKYSISHLSSMSRPRKLFLTYTEMKGREADLTLPWRPRPNTRLCKTKSDDDV